MGGLIESRRIDEMMVERASRRTVGRSVELGRMATVLEPDGPVVCFVHGIAGIGKTSLVRAFASRARQSGARVVELDGAGFEPSPGGFTGELAGALGLDGDASGREVIATLGRIEGPAVIVVDVYERQRLLDTWLRQEFVPAMPDHCRVVIAGRDRPLLAWTAALAGAGALLEIALDGLAAADAAAMLASAGIVGPAADELVRLTHGHPLALQLVAAAPDAATGPARSLARSRVLHELATTYVGDLPVETRTVVEAASVVRRVTRSLLRAMLPGVPPGDAFERLAALPFTTRTDEGLALHDLVRDAVQSALRADDPAAYRSYRRAAWEQLVVEARAVGPGSLWRYTADMLALIDNPVVREAFFPASTEFLAVEPARPADEHAIAAIVAASEPPAAADALGAWLERRPDRFSVVRDHGGNVVGFYALCRSDDVTRAEAELHPLLTAWRDHLRHHPVGVDELVLFMPRWLSLGLGEAACPAQAASWLDVKRIYMELRPRLRRLYTVVTDLGAWAPVVLPLGFTPLADVGVEFDGIAYHTALLDFGPGSVDGWLAMRVAGELETGSVFLDPTDRSVRTADGRVQLTRLEFGVLEALSGRVGSPVTRQQLLASVWGSDYTEGSNVVDAVVRTLRAKLGADAARVETVRGLGYRLTPA